MNREKNVLFKEHSLPDCEVNFENKNSKFFSLNESVSFDQQMTAQNNLLPKSPTKKKRTKIKVATVSYLENTFENTL